MPRGVPRGMSEFNEKEPASHGHRERGQEHRRPMVLAAVIIGMLCVLAILLIIGVTVL